MRTLTLVHLPVKVSEYVVFGNVRCSRCGHEFELYWVIELKEGFTHLTCTDCGAEAGMAIGTVAKVDISVEPAIAMFVCKDAVEGITRAAVAQAKRRES